MLPDAHIDQDTLELYALGRIAEPDRSDVEEHVLLCGACQARLQDLDEFIMAFRMAGKGPGIVPMTLGRSQGVRVLHATAGSKAG